jgi:hypothetical protein
MNRRVLSLEPLEFIHGEVQYPNTYWAINDLVTDLKSLPALSVQNNFSKLLDRKKREFANQSLPFKGMSRDPKIDEYLSSFRFIGKDEIGRAHV